MSFLVDDDVRIRSNLWLLLPIYRKYRTLRNWINHPKEMISAIQTGGNSIGQMTWFLLRTPGSKKSLMLFEITRKLNLAWIYSEIIVGL